MFYLPTELLQYSSFCRSVVQLGLDLQIEIYQMCLLTMVYKQKYTHRLGLESTFALVKTEAGWIRFDKM